MMGARNVSACFTLWPHLPHGPFRLLVGMALQSLDAPSKEGRPARVFFGGEDALVDFLGESHRATAYRALSALREAGAIEVLDHGRQGHRAVYKLALTPMESAEEGSQNRDAKAEVQGRRNATRKGRKSATEGSQNCDVKGRTSATPRKDEGSHKESREGDISPKVPVSLGADDDEANDDESSLSESERIERRNRRLIAKHGLEPALRLINGGKIA
jgi:hypothetical protein